MTDPGSSSEPGPGPRRRRRLFVLGAIGIGVGLALVLGEIGVRAGESSGWIHEPRRHFRPGIYVADRRRGWALAPGYEGAYLEYAFRAPTTTNQLGFRGPEWSEERARADLRVLVLGDSCTFGRGVDDAATFPAQLEQLLLERAGDERSVAVFNSGVPGYDTVQEERVAGQLWQAVRPHVLLVAWLSNDVTPGERSSEQIPKTRVHEGYLVAEGDDYEEWRAKIEHRGLYASSLYRFLRVHSKLLKASLGSRRDRWQPPGVGELDWSLQPLGRLARRAMAEGVRPVLVMFARQEEVEREDPDLAYREALIERTRAQGWTVIDLLPGWRATAERPRFLARDYVHLTRDGYGEVAAAVVEEVVAALDSGS